MTITDRCNQRARAGNRFRLGALIAASFLLLACGGPPVVQNVVLICIDTVRYDAFWLPELEEDPDGFTPWAEKAIVYTHALTVAPWTVPTVATVFTGYYPSQHGAGLFDDPVANLSEAVPSRIFDGLPTITEIINEADIRTMGYSSHPWFNSDYGLKRGFRQLYLYQGAPRLLEEADGWLDQRDPEQRFFLYLHFMDAHDRQVTTSELQGDLARVPPARVQQIKDSAPGGICEDVTDSMCSRWLAYNLDILDLRESVADFLGGLDRRGLLEDTAVILYSDHGEEFYDHLAESEALAADPRGIYGFGHGHSLYQELLHVPLVAWFPGRGGGVSPDPVSLVDIAPTLLAWLGIGDPGSMPGEVLGFRTRGGKPDETALRAAWPESSRVLFASGIAYGPEQFAVIQGPRKYVWHEQSRAGELFDLVQDVSESAPLENDAVVAQFDAELDRYLTWYSEQPFVTPDLSAEQLERLKGVGYLQGVAGEDENDENGADDPQGPDEK